MKRYKMIVVSLAILFISFFMRWYSDQLVYSLFVFVIIPNLLLLILVLICFVTCLVKVMKERTFLNVISTLILIISVCLFFFFPFRETKVRYELSRFEEERLEVIEKIITKELIPDDLGNVILEDECKKLSTSGEVVVYQNDENGQVIGFWVFRGMLSGSMEVVYSTGGEELIWANETGHPITSIQKLKDNWYYVETDY